MSNDEKYLFKILQGENMGIHLYKKYLSKLPSGPEKRAVEDFLEEHKRHKRRIENILESKGIKSINSSVGIRGNIVETFQGMKLAFRNKPKDIIKKIYKGEVTGTITTQKYLMELSESIKPDIKKIIGEDMNRVEKIHDLLVKI